MVPVPARQVRHQPTGQNGQGQDANGPKVVQLFAQHTHKQPEEPYLPATCPLWLKALGDMSAKDVSFFWDRFPMFAKVYSILGFLGLLLICVKNN